MPRLFKTPKMLAAFTLALIFLSAVFKQPSVYLFLRLFLAVVFAVGCEVILLRLRKVEPFFPSAAVVTALIILLLLPPNSSIMELLITILIAIFAKHFIRINKKHLFNPAALGLFVGGVFFNHIVAWWGVSWQQLKFNNPISVINFLILFAPLYISAIKMRRLKIIVSFLLIYNLYYYFFAKAA